MDEDTGLVRIDPRADSHSLRVAHTLIPTTFANIDEYVVVDPCAAEEGEADGACTVVYSERGALCGVYKPGGRAYSPELMAELMRIAKARAAEVAAAFFTAGVTSVPRPPAAALQQGPLGG